MRTEIFIEGNQLDITDGISALFTLAVDDIRDFGSRDTTFSKTIEIPGSGRNNYYFGHSFQFEAFNPTNPAQPNVGANFNAAKAAACFVLVDSLQVFKGILRLLEIVIENGAVVYQCAVFGELGGLVNSLGNKMLTDLDFSAYDQVWNAGNISASWLTALTGAGVYYPLIDYGGVSTDKTNFEYKAFRPALHVREYLVKMLDASGYTYDWPQLNTELIKRLIVPHNEDQVYRFVNLLLSRTTTGTQSNEFIQEGNGSPADLTTNFVAFPAGAIDLFTPDAGNQQFTYTGTVAATGTLQYQVAGQYFGGQSRVFMRVYVEISGVPRISHDVYLDLPFPYGTTGRLYEIGSTISISVVPGDVLRIRAEIIGAGAGGHYLVTVNGGNLIFRVNAKVAAPAQLNNTLQINNCIPKGILQKDFLASIVKMFNLYIVEDPQIRKRLLVRPYPDFYDYNTRRNWNAKIDYEQPISLKPMAEINARFFNFLYEKDSDSLNEQYRNNHGQGYGDFVFDAGAAQGLDFVKDKKEVKLIFAGSPLKSYAGKDKYFTPIYKIDSNGVESNVESKIRILQAKRITGVTSWNLTNGGSTIASYTSYGYAGHLNDPVTPTADINFGAPAELFYGLSNPYPTANLFNAYYSAYMAEICDKDSKLLTAYFRLTALDIASIDFRFPVFIGGVLWRLNKVIDYDTQGNGLTKVELIKVINTVY